MNAHQLLDALGGVREDFIREAAPVPPAAKRRRVWPALAAACLAAVLAVGGLWPRPSSGTGETRDGAPSVTVDGTLYIISPHLRAVRELPEGFVYTGEVEFDGEPHAYYTSPDRPEWVYLFHNCYDSVTQTTFDGYIRYVEESLRGLCLLRYQGKVYVFLNDTRYFPFSREVDPADQARYDRVEAAYGAALQDLPEGFVPVGNAVFDGYDLVPTSELGSNTVPCQEILADPEDPEVLLARRYRNNQPEYWVYVQYQE